MLVILANQYDAEAQALRERWSFRDARMLSCEDLSTAGWRYYLADGGISTAVIDSRTVGIDEISGVLTLMPYVIADALVNIVPEDRTYAAQEMMAFLSSWLSGLTCPVINRPTPTCLMGPSWRTEQWIHLAAQLGVPIHPISRHVALTGEVLPEFPIASWTTLNVVGDRCLGIADARLATHAYRLADAAGLDMLTVHFTSPEPDACFLGASLRPDISSPEIADAILENFDRSLTC